MDQAAQSIEKTKQGFEESFSDSAFYDRQTQDTLHLEKIMDVLQINEGMKILDLGTGTGYLAFAVAEKYPEAEVTGLDIVEKALDANQKRAEQTGLHHLNFVHYDGNRFPFQAGTFDCVITRYALHHFPAIHAAFGEISRVLKTGGTLFISDPAPNDDDKQRFVDAYMQLKKDGHIRFYTRNEWCEIAGKAGFTYMDDFKTRIRFPKKKNTAPAFASLIEKFDKEVIRGYDLAVAGDEIWITEQVNNLLFKKENG